MKQLSHMFYAMAFLSLGSAGKPVDWSEVNLLDALHGSRQRLRAVKIPLDYLCFAFEGVGFGWVTNQQPRLLPCLNELARNFSASRTCGSENEKHVEPPLVA